MDPYGRGREAGGEPARPSGVVEVDVRENDVREIRWTHPEAREPVEDGVRRRGGAGLHKSGFPGSHEVRRGDHGPAGHPRVDRREAGRRLGRRFHERGSVSAAGCEPCLAGPDRGVLEDVSGAR